jgi:hypothetical protein
MVMVVAPNYDTVVVVTGDDDDALDELDDVLDDDEPEPLLTPDPLDPWPKKPPLLLLVDEDDVVPLDELEVDAVAPRAGRRVATSPPKTPKPTMALTTVPCFSRWTSRNESALERRGTSPPPPPLRREGSRTAPPPFWLPSPASAIRFWLPLPTLGRGPGGEVSALPLPRAEGRGPGGGGSVCAG